MEGVVEGNDRCGFGHPVALNDQETHRTPKLFQGSLKRAAAADDGPELGTECALDIAEVPPAPCDCACCRNPAQQGRPFDCGSGLSPGTQNALRQAGQCGFEVGLEQGYDPRHGGQNGDAFTPDGLNEPGRHQPAFKVELGLEDGWNP